MRLIFIYGPPAVGKYTVAMELGRLTGFRVFHNQLSIEAVRPVFAFGTPSYEKLVKQLRIAVMDEAARTGTDLIFTKVYSHPLDDLQVADLCAAVEGHGGTVCLVRLIAGRDVIEYRATSEHRAPMGKLDTAAAVRGVMDLRDVYTPIPGRESFVIDNTAVPAAEAAQRIAEHYGLPMVPLATPPPSGSPPTR